MVILSYIYISPIIGICHPCTLRKTTWTSWKLRIKPFHTMSYRFIFSFDLCSLFLLGGSFVLRSISEKEAQRKSNCWIPRFLSQNKKYQKSSILLGVSWKFHVVNCNDNFAWLLWLHRELSFWKPFHESRLASRSDNSRMHDNNVPLFLLYH